jgi:hypothetical protein
VGGKSQVRAPSIFRPPTSEETAAEFATFFVHEHPQAVWAWDLAQRNLEVLRGIDVRYFLHIAEMEGQLLETERAIDTPRHPYVWLTGKDSKRSSPSSRPRFKRLLAWSAGCSPIETTSSKKPSRRSHPPPGDQPPMRHARINRSTHSPGRS